MALELLAGPFLVVDRASGTALTACEGQTWTDGYGLVVSATANGKTCFGTVQLDGAFYEAWDRAVYYGYGLALIGEAADLKARRRWHALHWAGGIGPFYEWDVDPVSLFAGAEYAQHASSHAGHARLHDRYLYAYWGSVRTSAGAEAAIPIDSYPNYLSWGAAPEEIVIGDKAGNACRYNWIDKMAVGPAVTLGMGCESLWYAARHGVYVSLHKDAGQFFVRVWATTPRPGSVSAPNADPVPTAGRRSTVTARVLGAHGEACAGEVVAWRLTGAGSLALAATETNAEGWATTYFDAPLDAVGVVQIDAEVAL